MSTSMDWLTRELTAIDKVRRNVVLLAALSTLLAFFPVRTDEISLLGARFTSDVVAFGLFHALVFYTLVLATRGWLHALAMNFERLNFDRQLDEQLAALGGEGDKAKAAHAAALRPAILECEVNLEECVRRAETAASELDIVRMRAGARSGTPRPDAANAVAAAEHALDAARAEVGREQTRLNVLMKAGDAEVADETRFVPLVRARRLSAQRPLVGVIAGYVIVGEYLFPVLFGAFMAFLLYRTQDFPMLWELQLLSH